MFGGLRNPFQKIVEGIRDRVSKFFGREKSIDTDVTVPSTPEPTADFNPDVPQNTDVDTIELEEEIADTDDDDFDDFLDDLSDEAYYSDIEQTIRTFQDASLEPEYIRVVRYATADEAQQFLDEAGLSEFAEVLFIEDEDLFTIAVYDSPGVTK